MPIRKASDGKTYRLASDGEWYEYDAPPEQPEQQGVKDLSLPDALISGAKAIPESAGKYASSAISSFAHPVDTASLIGRAAHGLGQNIRDENAPRDFMAKFEAPVDDRPIANAIGEDYKRAYGGWNNIKNTIATDPVRVASDLSVGLGAAGKLTGINKLTQAGRMVDPVNIAGRIVGPAIRGTGRVAGEVIGGLGTWTGGDSITTAARAGRAGGNKLTAFLNNMRGIEDQADIVPQAKAALSEMRNANYQKYLQSMNDINADPQILNFNKLESALSDANKGGTYSGLSGTGPTIKVSRAADTVRKEISRLIDDFRGQNPAEYHTAEGFDTIKRSIGDIMDNYDRGTPQYQAAKKVYDAAKQEIVKQAPKYADVMKDSQKGIETVKEIEKALSIGNKSSIDTALRKLQSIMRNNANTNYGSRVRQINALNEYGQGNIMEKLAGQSLNTWMPRGLGKLVTTGAGGYALGTMNPGIAAALLTQSPRLMGEAAVKAGQAYRGIADNKLLQSLITPAALVGYQQ